ncbi:hypothetical protein NE235_32965 [Actinoallomurus spadix]|uniref:TFIIB-type zinc ribbon-containing protein n=1 Tax=Actinoallomurus spadix TaxID=79912 RepID=A0ABN0WR55_9ACTN|nr:hypothetical protein [Actinoallomurus spadix]MCO5990933.1 hypothetical protein [Actinoallomurus spadix]
MSERFRDTGARLWGLARELLVVCPHCGGRAVVLVDPGYRECPRHPGEHLMAARRLSCPGCGHTGTWRPRPWRKGDGDLFFGGGPPLAVPRMTGPEDPFFGLPLWLRRRCRGRILWAYNAAHLDLLEGYVGARLRERHPHTGSGSLVERLPAWIKAAGNREEVLAAIRDLRTRL